MTDETEDKTNPRETRELLVVYAGPHALAVLALDADGALPLPRPAPLPFAPPAVLGVIAARGRMRTVIDPRPLLTPSPTQQHDHPQAAAHDTARHNAQNDEHDDARHDEHEDARHDADDAPQRQALLLKGDEQLALAVSRLGPTISVNLNDLLPPAHDFARGAIPHEGSTLILIDPAKLFDAATRGMERRRRRR